MDTQLIQQITGMTLPELGLFVWVWIKTHGVLGFVLKSAAILMIVSAMTSLFKGVIIHAYNLRRKKKDKRKKRFPIPQLFPIVSMIVGMGTILLLNEWFYEVSEPRFSGISILVIGAIIGLFSSGAYSVGLRKAGRVFVKILIIILRVIAKTEKVAVIAENFLNLNERNTNSDD